MFINLPHLLQAFIEISMADPNLSSDLEAESSAPKEVAVSGATGSKAKAKSRVPRALRAQPKTSSAREKDALRCHKALECQCAKAKPKRSSAAEPASPLVSLPVALLQPVVGDMPHHLPPESLSLNPDTGVIHPELDKPLNPGPTLTLHPGPHPEVEIAPASPVCVQPSASAPAGFLGSASIDNQLNIHSMLSDALAKILAAGLQQCVNPGPSTSVQPTMHGRLPDKPTTLAHREYVSSEDSEAGEEYPDEMEFSEDEDLLPEQPVFTGLFKPSVFKSLLRKAKATTKFGLVPPTAEGAASAKALHDRLFQVAKPDKDVIPCPPLFSEVVQSGWAQPGSLMAPSGLDKKLYCVAPELEDLLALPLVDAPVAALASSSVLSGNMVDGLRSEDRKAELAFRKTHQAAAWAVKAATSTSFFTRASLLWLRQLQERLSPEDTRLHQIVNKLVAAAEYSADASLNAAKFASRALSSAVTSRRLFWLRNWRADAKTKWKLASAPYKTPNLFGAALEPLLIEDKDKRKILPSSYRRPERRYTPYTQKQPFRSFLASGGAYHQQAYAQGTDRSSDRQSFRDRGHNQRPAKRPFQGSGHRSFRRGK